MKYYLLSTLFLICNNFLFAQSVDKKTGEISKDGNVIGRIEKSGGLAKTFILYNADDQELVSFIPNPSNGNDEYYDVFFSMSNNKGTCPGNLAFTKMIAKALVNSKLMNDGNYDAGKEARFMSAMMGKYYGSNVALNPNTNVNVNINTSSTNDPLLERNRKAMIQVFGNDVKQDFKKIASVKKTQKAQNGTIVKTIKIYNHNGKQIAEATAEGVMSTNYHIITLKDNRDHSVQAESTLSDVKEIIELLVDHYYL